MIITIDGVSVSGKSSYTKIIAEKLGLEAISSGKLYRYITKQIISSTGSDLEVAIKNILPDIHFTKDILKYLDDPELSSEQIEKQVSKVASYTIVRKLINTFLHDICMDNNVVLDGRDMGNVFSEADVKLFFNASCSKRLQAIDLQDPEEYRKLERKLKKRDKKYTFLAMASDVIQINPFHYSEDDVMGIIRKKLDEKFILCESLWDIIYVGPITSDMLNRESKRHDYPTLTIFESNLNFHSHEVLFFKEKYIPFIYNLKGDITPFLNKRIKLIVKRGRGFLSLTNEPDDRIEASFNFQSENILCSNIQGMKFLARNHISRIAMRGECFSGNTLLEETLTYGVTNFKEVIFRFTDPENNLLLGIRGTYLLLRHAKRLLNNELKLIVRIYKSHSNLSVLCPFVREAQEAIDIHNYITSKFQGNIGCMIEVPLLLYEGKEFMHLYNFFVLGVSDLWQLLQGCNREIFTLSHHNIDFTYDLLKEYFLPYMCKNQILYITSFPLYKLLMEKIPEYDIRLLTK